MIWRHRHSELALVLALSLALAGCGGAEDDLPREAVSGRVTLDGVPLKRATIHFDPEGQGSTHPVAVGGVVIDGSYSSPRPRGRHRALTGCRSSHHRRRPGPGRSKKSRRGSDSRSPRSPRRTTPSPHSRPRSSRAARTRSSSPSRASEAPRPEAEVSGRPPRGGRSRQEAPVGGGEASRAGSHRFGRAPAAFPACLRAPPAQAPRSAPAGARPSGCGLRPESEARKHAGSLEALRVTRPEAVASRRRESDMTRTVRGPPGLYTSLGSPRPPGASS